MTERPILFSAPMVRAILAGRKFQTRRVVKHEHASEIEVWAWNGVSWRFGVYGEGGVAADMGGIQCPYGAPGDRLWVRETWAPCEAPILRGSNHYRADGAVGRRQSDTGGNSWFAVGGWTMGISSKELLGRWVGPPKRWRPSIHMPRLASRITLAVTAVRVERLQGISEADAIAEGIEEHRGIKAAGVSSAWRDYGHAGRWHSDAVESYRSLWESINGPGSWAANPWAWCLTFEVLP